jgi:hypothetical protein
MKYKYSVGQRVTHRNGSSGIITGLSRDSRDEDTERPGYNIHVFGRMHGWWYEDNIITAVSREPYTTNVLGDFPKKEACDAHKI